MTRDHSPSLLSRTHRTRRRDIATRRDSTATRSARVSSVLSFVFVSVIPTRDVCDDDDDHDVELAGASDAR